MFVGDGRIVDKDARVESDRAGVAELARVLAPGGALILNLPAYAWLMSAHDTVAQTARRYSAETARQLVESAGLVPELMRLGLTRTEYSATMLRDHLREF